ARPRLTCPSATGFGKCRRHLQVKFSPSDRASPTADLPSASALTRSLHSISIVLKVPKQCKGCLRTPVRHVSGLYTCAGHDGARCTVAGSMQGRRNMKGLFSNGVKAVVLDLLPEFERANGVTPTVTWASTNMLMDEIRKGATGDLAILTDEAIDGLIRQGKMVAGSRVDLVRSAIGIAVRQGAPK